MSDILKDFLDRAGAPGKLIAGTIALISIMWSIGLVNAPATAHDIEVIESRVERIEGRTESLEETKSLVRDDLEKIRTEQAVQSEQLKGVNKKLDNILDKLDRM